MTPREQIAAMVLHGVISRGAPVSAADIPYSVAIADALIAHLELTKPEVVIEDLQKEYMKEGMR